MICQRCKFFVRGTMKGGQPAHFVGTCHRHPPTQHREPPTAERGYQYLTSSWPTTDDDTFCGEFRSVEDPKE